MFLSLNAVQYHFLFQKLTSHINWGLNRYLEKVEPQYHYGERKSEVKYRYKKRVCMQLDVGVEINKNISRKSIPSLVCSRCSLDIHLTAILNFFIIIGVSSSIGGAVNKLRFRGSQQPSATHGKH